MKRLFDVEASLAASAARAQSGSMQVSHLTHFLIATSASILMNQRRPEMFGAAIAMGRRILGMGCLHGSGRPRVRRASRPPRGPVSMDAPSTH